MHKIEPVDFRVWVGPNSAEGLWAIIDVKICKFKKPTSCREEREYPWFTWKCYPA